MHAEQVGGARLGRIEAQELRPLLALGQIGQITALQPVGLGGIPMLADKAGHIVVIRRPPDERRADSNRGKGAGGSGSNGHEFAGNGPDHWPVRRHTPDGRASGRQSVPSGSARTAPTKQFPIQLSLSISIEGNTPPGGGGSTATHSTRCRAVLQRGEGTIFLHRSSAFRVAVPVWSAAVHISPDRAPAAAWRRDSPDRSCTPAP